MVSSLVIKEKINVCGVEIPNISGGFGVDKKAILAKHIAEIHKRPVKRINELINRNRKRFKDTVDIIDLKGTDFEDVLCDHGIFTQNSLNRSTNVYLLSERGYAKIVKISDDDKSWELYDQILDEYFDMKEEISNVSPINNKPMSSAEMLMMYAQQFLEQEQRLNQIEQTSNKIHNKVTHIQTYLTETPDRKKIEREINAYARRNDTKQSDVRIMIYNKIEDKYGIDVMQRVENKRKRINDKRIENGKKPYAHSTLKQKVNGMDIVAEEGLMKEVMEILAGVYQ